MYRVTARAMAERITCQKCGNTCDLEQRKVGAHYGSAECRIVSVCCGAEYLYMIDLTLQISR